MNTKPLYIGADVSKAHLDLAVFGHKQVRRFSNDAVGITRLIEHLDRLDAPVGRMVVEASGGYELELCDALHEHDVAIARVNARCARDYAKATGRLQKTDSVDAHALADFARVNDSALYQPPSADKRELIELQRTRQKLADDRGKLGVQRQRAASASVKRIYASRIELLDELIKQCDSEIKASLKAQPEVAADIERLRSIPGVGPATALTLVCEVPELGELNAKQAAKLVGVAPLNNDSGERRGKASIWGGRARVRRLLYMAAMVARRLQGPLKEHFERLTTGTRQHQGEPRPCRPKKVALIALMRKILIYANVLIRDQTTFDPEKIRQIA